MRRARVLVHPLVLCIFGALALWALLPATGSSGSTEAAAKKAAPRAHIATTACSANYGTIKLIAAGSYIYATSHTCISSDSNGRRGWWYVYPDSHGGNFQIAGCYYVSLAKLYSTGWTRVTQSGTYCDPTVSGSSGLHIYTPYGSWSYGDFCAKVWTKTPAGDKQVTDIGGNPFQKCGYV